MKKYEYLYIRDGTVEPRGLTSHTGVGAVGASQIMTFLNKLGSEGWQLIDTERDYLCTEFSGILIRERRDDG